MNKWLHELRTAKSSFFAVSFFFVAAALIASTNVAQAKLPGRDVVIPAYGDFTVWGQYFRQLQDTVATSWYKEIFYYGYPRTFTRGVVTARFTVEPGGKFVFQQILSNTANQPMANAVSRAIQKAWIQPFPRDVAAAFPNGLVLDQSFRFSEYDPTNYGLASSYPQLLVRRSPELGAAKYLDIRKFPDLSVFRYQSRILQASPAKMNRIASR
jgi:hypothetical protein